MKTPPSPDREMPATPIDVPACMIGLVQGYCWARDTIGESGGTVYRLHAPGRPDLYLKHGIADIADAVTDEMIRLRWLGQHMPVPQVRHFVATPHEAWLLMTAIAGRTAHQCLEADPDRRPQTVDAIARFLRTLHALPVDACPFDSRHSLRLRHARRRLDAGQVDADDFGDAHDGWTPRRVWDAMIDLLPIAADSVVTHGDYSLDNILLVDGRVTGVIDVGRVGVADRYQDLAILWDCLGEFDSALQDRLFRTYGLPEPDERRIRFHLCLDEFF